MRDEYLDPKNLSKTKATMTDKMMPQQREGEILSIYYNSLPTMYICGFMKDSLHFEYRKEIEFLFEKFPFP